MGDWAVKSSPCFSMGLSSIVRNPISSGAGGLRVGRNPGRGWRTALGLSHVTADFYAISLTSYPTTSEVCQLLHFKCGSALPRAEVSPQVEVLNMNLPQSESWPERQLSICIKHGRQT